jgi:hypothetical protein
MRIPCVLGVVVCLVSTRADADVSKAWQAAKDNLPASTPIVLAVDVAALQKSPALPHLIETLKAEERGFREAYNAFRAGCNLDPLSMVDGFVIAADPKADEVVIYMQLTIDRAKATTCLSSAMVSLDKDRGKQVTMKQDGIYTVASKGTGKHDTAYFPWLGPNVVMVSLRPDRKDKVDGWFNQKGFWQSKLSAKVDPRVAVSGGLATDKPFDSMLPLLAAHGTLTIAGGKITASISGTATDAGAAAMLVAGMKKEIERDLKREKTPPSIKKVFGALAITNAGTDVTLKASVTEKELGAAFAEVRSKKEKEAVGSSDARAAVEKMDDFSKKMCSCKDKACADKVNEEMTKWGTEMAKSPRKDEKPSVELAKRAAEIMTRYTECMTKLMMAKP